MGSAIELPPVERLHELFELRGGWLYRKVSTSSKARAGARAGCLKQSGYIGVMVDGRLYRAHRIIWVMCHGVIPAGMEIDHVNGDKTDNKVENLRLATRSENNRNQRGAQSNSRSGIRGVSRNHGGWRARVRVDGREIQRTFKSIYAAAVCADLLRWKYHNEFVQPTPGLWDHAY